MIYSTFKQTQHLLCLATVSKCFQLFSNFCASVLYIYTYDHTEGNSILLIGTNCVIPSITTNYFNWSQARVSINNLSLLCTHVRVYNVFRYCHVDLKCRDSPNPVCRLPLVSNWKNDVIDTGIWSKTNKVNGLLSSRNGYR